MTKLRETAQAFAAALKEAKEAGLDVVVEQDGQGVAVKCFPLARHMTMTTASR